MCHLGTSTSSICINLISILQLEPCIFISYYLTSARHYINVPCFDESWSRTQCFCKFRQDFLSISNVLPVIWTSSINAITLILAHTWLYHYAKDLQGVKEYLWKILKRFHFSLFESSEKYHRFSFIQSETDSSSILYNVRAQNPLIRRKR